MLSHVQEYLRLKQRGLGPRSGPEMEMESPRVEIPITKSLYPDVFQLVSGPDEVMGDLSEWENRLFDWDRRCTLTHVCNNAFADSSTSKVGPVHGGLSSLGRSAVVEMNRLGMIIDLSHASADTARQTLHLTQAPIMFSHSNAQAQFDCPRNIPDDVLDLVPSNAGIVMVTFVPEHVCHRRADATMDMVLDHLFYIAGRIGWDHVGLGSDFDGIASTIRGLEDVRCYPALMGAILDRGATEDQLAKVAGGNILRVWRDVVAVGEKMRQSGVLPVEDVWEGREWWRYDGYYQMRDPDPEDRRGLGWYGAVPPDEGLYLEN